MGKHIIDSYFFFHLLLFDLKEFVNASKLEGPFPIVEELSQVITIIIIGMNLRLFLIFTSA